MAWTWIKAMVERVLTSDTAETNPSRREMLRFGGAFAALAIGSPLLLSAGEARAQQFSQLELRRDDRRDRRDDRRGDRRDRRDERRDDRRDRRDDRRDRRREDRFSRRDLRRLCREDRRFRRNNRTLCFRAEERARDRGSCVQIGPVLLCD